jgi:hypothetical protein
MAKPPYKLQLTKGFFADVGQISRMLAVAAAQDSRGRVSPQVFADEMGVSASRVSNLASLAVAFELLRPVVMTSTDLGTLLYRHDPYLDQIGTLWLLHHLVSSNPRYVVWNRLVNRMIPENTRLSTVLARPYFDDLVQYFSARSVDEHLRKEIGSFWNAYTEQTFAHLDYLRAESDLIYVRGNPRPVPPRIFLAATLLYRERYAPGAATLGIPTLASAANSPGRVFGLTERQVRDLLEEVEEPGGIYVESRADLDQVRFPDGLTFLDAVRRHYEEC